MASNEQLKFKVASHIVEDLGLNLYTSLPRVLAEFIANAYDADSRWVDVRIDVEKIKAARAEIKRTYQQQKSAAAKQGRQNELEALARRTLPSDLTIEIEDRGHGMSRDDLAKKFLIAGRRRRKVEPQANGRTPGGRPLMGRKGLGKLAGFGVGKVVDVISRIDGESHATKVTLSYDDLAEVPSATDGIPVPEELLADGGGLPSTGGTRIVMRDLLYDPTDADEVLIESEIAEHFELIDPSEFSIKMNGNEVRRNTRTHDFAWPDPSTPVEEWVDHNWTGEDGRSFTLRYRLRFTGRNQALIGSRRGVRIYSHGRLASAPSRPC